MYLTLSTVFTDLYNVASYVNYRMELFSLFLLVSAFSIAEEEVDIPRFKLHDVLTLQLTVFLSYVAIINCILITCMYVLLYWYVRI